MNVCIILNVGFIDYNIGFTRLLLPQILFIIHNEYNRASENDYKYTSKTQ